MENIFWNLPQALTGTDSVCPVTRAESYLKKLHGPGLPWYSSFTVKDHKNFHADFSALAAKKRHVQALHLLKIKAKNLGSCPILKINARNLTSMIPKSIVWTAALQTVAGRLLASLRAHWLWWLWLLACSASHLVVWVVIACFGADDWKEVWIKWGYQNL